MIVIKGIQSVLPISLHLSEPSKQHLLNYRKKNGTCDGEVEKGGTVSRPEKK